MYSIDSRGPYAYSDDEFTRTVSHEMGHAFGVGDGYKSGGEEMNIKKIVIVFISAIIAIIIVRMFWEKLTERTDEEYISIFLNNKEDFEYVAEMMKRWPDRSIIYLEGGISSENREVANEIKNNTEFYRHLKKLHDLEEIDNIYRWKEKIVFAFSKPPKNYHGGWYYWDKMEERGISTVNKIDEHWTLVMVPDV